MVIHGMAIAFAQCKMAHAASAAVYGLPVAAFEIMPAWQGFTLVAQAIGTAFRQPAELVARQIAQIDAIFDFLLAARIIATAGRFNIQQSTRDTGEVNFSRVDVFHFIQATQPATVAKRFPLGITKLIQRFVPPVQSVQALDVA